MEAEKNSMSNAESFRVVHACVTNLLYPVDIDLIHYLFTRYGDVEKIVTFSKSPTMYQALIQFQNAEQAREALSKLNGRNIYDGCNTLQIQPSRLQELIVKNNTTKSWDYTIQRGGPSANLPAGGGGGATAAGGLAPPGGAAVGAGGVVVVDGQQQLGAAGGLGAVNNGRGAAGGGAGGAGAAAGVGAGGAAGPWGAPPPHLHAAAAGYGQQQQQHGGTPPLPGTAGAGGAAAGGAAAGAGGAAGLPPRLLHPHVGPPPHPLQQQHGGVGIQPPPPNHHGVGLAPGGPGVQQQHPVHAMQPPHPLAAGGAGAGGRVGGGPLGAGHHHGSNLLHLLEKVPRELRELLEYTNPTQTPVIIVYNLPNNITVQMLFNVFSLYGSVLRIKILREKTDTALIQYSDPLYATIAHNYIQGANLMGQTLQVAFSKNMEVKLPPPQPAKADGATPLEEEKRTVAFSIRDQRYGGDDVEKYVKGSCKPTKTIFVANLDEAATEEEIQKLFSEYGAVSKFTFKAPKSESAKTQMAMMEMGSEAEALTALMYLHNHELHGRSMKVAFSKTVL